MLSFSSSGISQSGVFFLQHFSIPPCLIPYLIIAVKSINRYQLLSYQKIVQKGNSRPARALTHDEKRTMFGYHLRQLFTDCRIRQLSADTSSTYRT